MEIFHVLNRGVDKRSIVLTDADRFRFMQGLYLYNDKNLLNKNTKRLTSKPNLLVERKLLVHIHAFCLMDNHYHLLLSPVADDLTNLSAFMRKLNMGYAKYFNEKYDRSGALWQGKHKKIHVSQESHFLFIPYYIHLNPLDFEFPEWREGKVVDVDKAIVYLSKYKWSSYLDYSGTKNYPSILYQKLFTDLLTNKQQQLEAIKSIITSPEKVFGAEMLEK